jgi:glycosyltransferase involved in cell wall biosynthesis
VNKILYIGDAASPHLARWVKLAHSHGFEVSVFSFRTPAPEIAQLSGVKYEVYEGVESLSSSFLFKKFSYLKAFPALRSLAKSFQPDIVHAHYASSYGLLASLLARHPLIISAWGSDVFAFGDSRIGRMILRYNFSKADRILSTSEVMKKRVMQFSPKEIEVTPFGVDVDLFHPGKVDFPLFSDAELVFGMIKTMNRIYGVDLALLAFKQVMDRFPERRLKLLLVGGGDTDNEFRNLAERLGISAHVHFTGRIEQIEVPHYHRMIDVFLNPSRAESFGVSVLEAMACGRAVIVSQTGGLEEIVTDQVNGLYCQPGDIESLANRMLVLVDDLKLRTSLSEKARVYVKQKYDKTLTDERALKVYQSFLPSV